MEGTKSDWLVYNLNLLFGQGFYPRSRAGLIFRQAIRGRYYQNERIEALGQIANP